MFCEDASAGTQLIQSLKKDSHTPVVAVKVRDSKIARVEALTPTFEPEKVLLPKSASWLSALEEELYAFPAARHDESRQLNRDLSIATTHACRIDSANDPE
ncbi:MAG: phage terminase large subunit [Candidatus Eremiobacteraeota bacterium]|nr:phage terminase large subunit [Candidatus Eremiobacteraeota bacterium]